jgi:hypothetical protein
MKWQKGQSGNPKGRIKGKKVLTDELRRLLDAKWRPFGQTNRELLAQVLMAKALQGDLKAIEYIWDRLEGRPAQAVQVTGDGRRPLRIYYVDGNEGGEGSQEGKHNPSPGV